MIFFYSIWIQTRVSTPYCECTNLKFIEYFFSIWPPISTSLEALIKFHCRYFFLSPFLFLNCFGILIICCDSSAISIYFAISGCHINWIELFNDCIRLCWCRCKLRLLTSLMENFNSRICIQHIYTLINNTFKIFYIILSHWKWQIVIV